MATDNFFEAQRMLELDSEIVLNIKRQDFWLGF